MRNNKCRINMPPETLRVDLALNTLQGRLRIHWVKIMFFQRTNNSKFRTSFKVYQFSPLNLRRYKASGQQPLLRMYYMQIKLSLHSKPIFVQLRAICWR